MPKLITILLCLFCLTSFHIPPYTECDIEAFYSGVTPTDGTMVLTSQDEIEEAKLLLVPMTVDAGKYVVNITRKGANLYKIDGKNIFIKTKYCYEYSYSKEVAISVESSYGYTKGKIIF